MQLSKQLALHLLSLLAVLNNPALSPYFSIAWILYSEQVG